MRLALLVLLQQVLVTGAEEEDRGRLIHFHACGSSRCNVNETWVVSAWSGTEEGQTVIRQSREQVRALFVSAVLIISLAVVLPLVVLLLILLVLVLAFVPPALIMAEPVPSTAALRREGPHPGLLLQHRARLRPARGVWRAHSG